MSYPAAEPDWRHYRVAHGILIESGQVLLVANVWYPDAAPVWSLPGGRAEAGESISTALVREWREETGLDVESGPLIYVAEAQSPAQRRHFLTCAFVVRRVGGTLGSQDAAVAELRFVPLADLPQYLPAPSLGAPLQAWLADPNGPARYWFFPDYAQG
jgi:8-oxo-dGTP diphosphatase